MRRGFTLIELLVVIAIIAILAAILFPVFAQARSVAKKIGCASNFNQLGKAIEMYKGDNGGKYPPTDQTTGQFKPPDKNWPQIAMGYIRSWEVLACPSDPDQNPANWWRDLGGKSCNANDRACQEYGRSGRTNFGLNFQYISPLQHMPDRPVPAKETMVTYAAKTILGVDSLWDRDAAGKPIGGGFLVVDPPCRIALQGNLKVDTFHREGWSSFWYVGAWTPNNPLYVTVYGLSWPRHADMMNTIFCDTHVKAMRVPQITAGCNVLNAWQGIIYDREAYLWDLDQ